MWFQRHWWKLALALLLVVVLFRVPQTLRLIIFLLPLGSGFDDLIEIVALVALVVVLFAKGWVSIPGLFKRR